METTLTAVPIKRAPAPADRARRELALVLLWSREQPERVGEVAILTPTADARPYVLGRGGGRPDLHRVAWVRQRPGRNHTDNIIVRRGYTNNDELFNWYDVVRDGRVERKSGSIIIAGDDASEITRFNFFEAWPCRWSLLVFDGDDSTTLIEEIEIAVERIEKG